MATEAPTVLDPRDIVRLLKATRESRAGEIYHYIIYLGLKTALRLKELRELRVGHVFELDGTPRYLVVLPFYKGQGNRPDDPRQVVPLGKKARAKMRDLWRYKKARGEDLGPEAPLFIGREGPLSADRISHAFGTWQRRAGCARVLHFHCLRHSAITAFYRKTKDVKATMTFARHRNITTTDRYTHANNLDVALAVEDF